MSNLRGAATLRGLTRHPGQMVLSVLGVALGVAVVVALDLTIQSSRAAFEASATTVAGRATHTVVGGPMGIDESIFREIRLGLGVRAAAPIVEGFVTTPLLPGLTLRVLGVDPFSEIHFRPELSWAAGTGSEGGGGMTGIASLIAIHRGVFLSREMAREAGLRVGEEFVVLTPSGPQNVVLAGELWAENALARVGMSDLLVMDIAVAQELLGRFGRLSRIDLMITGSPNPTGFSSPMGARRPPGTFGLPPLRDTPEPEVERTILSQVRSVLPGDARLESAGVRTRTLAAMIRAFNLNLSALSLLALVFGMFLIYNTMTFSVVRRRGLIASLRALGVTRSEIFRSVIFESFLLGVVGSALGLVAGVLLGRGLVGLVTRTINDLYFVVHVDGLSVPPAAMLKGLFIGIAATVLASLPPAWEATGTDVRRSFLRSNVEASARRGAVGAARLAAVLMAVAVPVLVWSEDSLFLSFGAIFLLILGMAMFTPMVTILLIGAIVGPLHRVGGAFWAIAARSVVMSLSRTGPAIAALVVSISVVVGLGSMITSFRGTLVSWLDGTLQADVYVSLPSAVSARVQGSLDLGMVETLRGARGVVGWTTYRAVEIPSDYGVTGVMRLLAVELDPRGEAAFDFLDGGGERAFARFREGRGVLLSEPFAYKNGLGVGDDVRIPTPGGAVSLPVLGIFYDYGSETGTVMISRLAYDGHWDDPGITSLGLFLEEDADVEVMAARLRRLVGEGTPDALPVSIRSNRALREGSLEVFDRTFAVTGVLRGLAVAVAFLGVLSALLALQLERSRELGLLRALGLTSGEVWRLITAETSILGFVAGIQALPVGIALAWIMIFIVNKRSFGWTLQMEVPPELLLQAVGLAVGGAVLAGLYPAWRMSRVQPAHALRDE